MRLIASTLVLSLLISTPGLAPYALAASFASPAGRGLRVVIPGGNAGAAMTGRSGSVPLNLSVNLTPGGVPLKINQQIPGLIGGPNQAAELIPGINTGMNAGLPTLTPTGIVPVAAKINENAVSGDKLSVIEAGQNLQNELGASNSESEKGSSLDKFYSKASLSDAPGGDVTPGSNNQQGQNPGLHRNGGNDGRKDEAKAPVSPETNPELFAPRSSRVGIGPLKFLYWNAIYKIVQWANLKFAKDPNRRVSWDKWPTELGLLYLIGKIRFVRSGTLTDPYDYASNDIKNHGKEPEQAKRGYTTDGKWVSDRENPAMGAENTRFGSNIPPQKVRPDVENLMLKAREIGKLKWRQINEATGKAIVKPALILNDLAGGWIQFNFHNFGGNTKRDDIKDNPHKVEMPAKEGWAEKEMVVDRTTKDPSRVTDNGRPTIMNERTQAWIHAQIYGTNDAEQNRLRTFKDGKFLLDENGNLPADPNKPGIDLSGFTNNYNPLLSFLHWAFVLNHNAAADHVRKFNPDWDDQKIFDYARKMNVAVINQIHTTEWTEDLLQHPTLQKGMHTEFYGPLGPKAKAWMMRFSHRHPWFAWLIQPLRSSDVFWGMPGSKWEHHDGPFQVPKHFRMVYRLHELILDEHEFIQPGTDKLLGRVDLIDFIQKNTRPIVEKYGYDVLAYSFVKKSAGALALHNFPRAMTQFRDQQHDKLTDLAMLDIFREMTDGTGSYNEFRRSVGEPPVKSFLELTGGDAELAREIEKTFEGDIEAVPPGIGILAEPKPAGFALGFTQFYQFVLNAPRRVKSNRHMTEFYTHKDYTFEGMEWVWHSGGMGGVIARAMKTQKEGQAVVNAMEGVTRWFAPWQPTETFPVRLLDQAEENSGKILKKTFSLLKWGAFTAFAAWMGVAVSSFTLVPLVTAALALPILIYYKRMLAWRFMQKAWQSAYTDKRRSMFPTLFLGEKWARHSATLGRLGAYAPLALGLFAAVTLFSTNPFVALFAGITALKAKGVLSATSEYENTMALLKIALQNRLREGYAVRADPASVPGATALEKRYWFLIPADSKKPVAGIWHTYKVLHEHGLGRLHSFKTALLSHLIFGPRTQRGLGISGRWKAGTLFNPFAIYLPNIAQAQGPASWRIYASKNNTKGLKPGDVDMDEFNDLFANYAPGRDYLTAYDFSRMREGNHYRAKKDGLGNPVSRFLGNLAVKARSNQLLELYADVVANEDKHLVPAISRDMLLRVYQGTAQADIMEERALDGVSADLRRPKPINPDAKPSKWQGFKDAARKFRGSLVLPLSWAAIKTDARAAGTFFSDVKKLGWVVVAGIFGYYLVRDSILYILIPYLIYKGIIG